MSRTSSGESFYSAVSHLSKPSAKLIDSCPVDIFYEHREYLKKWNVEQEISTLEDVTENLHLINHWLHKEIHKTENKCKNIKGTFDKELKTLDGYCEEVKCALASLAALRHSMRDGSNCDMNTTPNCCESLRQQEIVMLEKEMRLVEPKLFQKYQAIYKHPRKKNMILDSILSTLNRKRIALRKMAAVIKQKRLFSSLDASSVFQHHVRNRCSESFSRTCKSTTKTESKRTTNAICFCRRV